MLKMSADPRTPRRASPLLMVIAVLVAAAAAGMLGCESEKAGPADTSAGVSEAPAEPEILSLAPAESAGKDAQELVLAWKPVPGVERYVLCETVPPYGTECREHLGVSETTVLVPGPTGEPLATGTWLKYVWLQACGPRHCSSPPTAAGAIAHRVAYGTDAWNFIVVARRLESGRVEVALANASQGATKTSTLLARAPGGSEIARCDAVASGRWCGPFEGALLSNDIAAEQIYLDMGVTVEFPVMPSTTAPQGNPPAP